MNTTITITLGQAIEAIEALSGWATHPFPAREAFQIGRVLARLKANPDIVAALESRMSLFQKHGQLINGNYRIEGEAYANFMSEWLPTAATKIEIDAPLLPLSLFDHAPAMTPNAMLALDPLLAQEVPATA